MTHYDLSNFIWNIADLLRGPYRPPQYERVMLPLVILRRFDCVLEANKEKVLVDHARYKDKYQGEALDKLLNKAAGQKFHNHSPLNFQKLKGDPDNIDKHLVSYINGFSENVRRIFEYFEFTNEIEKMREANILYLVISKFCEVDLHVDEVGNDQMGLLFENLIRRFNELANETAGDHFTPREVIRLMVHLLFINDDALLATPGTVRKMLDPACGTGGMLAEAQSYMHDHHAAAELWVYGQDYNKRSYAVAASDLLIKGHEKSDIRYGDSLIDDQYKGERFDYLIANPPFGVDWKKQQKEIAREFDKLGFSGRFGAGLPRVNDGALLFLQHMVSKFEPVKPKENLYGSRLAIVFNGSPLFTGGAGGGESEIRKWIIENDWLEAIVALPEQMFYNTGIGTYIWIVTNRKEKRRKGKIQLIDARDRWVPLRRALGDKRRELSDEQIAAVVREHGDALATATSKLFDNADFGYARVTVERPLRLKFQITLERKEQFLDGCPHLLDDMQAIDKALGREEMTDWNAVGEKVQKVLKKRESRWRAPEAKFFREVFTETDSTAAPVVASKRGGEVAYEADSKLRDFENVPLKETIDDYFRREVRPHVPDAWIDHDKTKVGYEINFNRHFYSYTPPRLLAEIDADLKRAEDEIVRLLREVTA
ncbi:MAG: type I restriction-modification system subunit M [Desulfuromonadales bacterium]